MKEWEPARRRRLRGRMIRGAEEGADEDDAAAFFPFVGFAAGKGQVVEGAGLEGSGVLEEGIALGAEGDEAGGPDVAGAGDGELDNFATGAAALVGRVNVDGAEFDGRFGLVVGKAGAGHDGAVDFEDVKAVEVAFDGGAGAAAEGVGRGAEAGHVVDRLDVAAAGGADLLVGVGVKEGAHALFLENFGEETAEKGTVDDVGAGDTVFEGAEGFAGFAGEGRVEPVEVVPEVAFQFVGGKMALELAVADEAGETGEENELGGLEADGEVDGGAVGVEPEGFPVAGKGDGGNEGEDVVFDEAEKEGVVEFFDFAGVEEIASLDDAAFGRADGVGLGAAQGGLGKAGLEEMAGLRGGGGSQGEGFVIGGADAVRVAQGEAAGGGEITEKLADAEDDDGADLQTVEDGDIGKEVGQVFVGEDGAIEGEDEGLALKHGDIPEDATQVGGFEDGLGGGWGEFWHGGEGKDPGDRRRPAGARDREHV